MDRLQNILDELEKETLELDNLVDEILNDLPDDDEDYISYEAKAMKEDEND